MISPFVHLKSQEDKWAIYLQIYFWRDFSLFLSYFVFSLSFSLSFSLRPKISAFFLLYPANLSASPFHHSVSFIFLNRPAVFSSSVFFLLLFLLWFSLRMKISATHSVSFIFLNWPAVCFFLNFSFPPLFSGFLWGRKLAPFFFCIQQTYLLPPFTTLPE